MLIDKHEVVRLKHNNDSKHFIEYWNDMIVVMLYIKKYNPLVTKLFTRGRKLNISLFLITNLLLYQNSKFCIHFYDENSKQTKASTSCN